MNIFKVSIVLGLVAVTGCRSYGSSDTVKPLPVDLAQHVSVSEIVIGSLPANVSPDFKGKLEASLKERMATCAKGDQPLRLIASVEKFEGENAAMTVLVGSSNSIKGSAQLVEPADGKVVGDYDISHSVGGGGILAAIGMAGSESKMADAFAVELCRQAFEGGK
jgi:hypothetical protein